MGRFETVGEEKEVGLPFGGLSLFRTCETMTSVLCARCFPVEKDLLKKM